ncbi:MAG: septal ring lytic transglycosylase RlpA family protein [Trueperaceae bacterium]|nr:septal ring lytic transglycosylase RlpA family protein [Trueperaceae bacterium]
MRFGPTPPAAARAALATAAALTLAACAPAVAPEPPVTSAAGAAVTAPARTPAEGPTLFEGAGDPVARRAPDALTPSPTAVRPSEADPSDPDLRAAPAVPPAWTQTGVASWYGPNFVGRPTANGETFDPTLLTAAHRTLPFGARVRVTNLTTERSVVVRINDRGPFVQGRVIDLSRAAADAIGMTSSGTARVRLAPAGPPSGPAPIRIDARLSGYDVVVPGARPGSLWVVRTRDGGEVLVRAVELPERPDAEATGREVWVAPSLAARVGSDAVLASARGE